MIHTVQHHALLISGKQGKQVSSDSMTVLAILRPFIVSTTKNSILPVDNGFVLTTIRTRAWHLQHDLVLRTVFNDIVTNRFLVTHCDAVPGKLFSANHSKKAHTSVLQRQELNMSNLVPLMIDRWQANIWPLNWDGILHIDTDL